MWKPHILTLFPEMFPGPLGYSLAGKALAEGKWGLEVLNIRDFALNKHHSVDDASYGGGHGLVMRADVIANALDSIANRPDKLIYCSPRGAPLTQHMVEELVAGPAPLFLCGRFEAVDQRLLDHYGFTEVSIADAVLSGGEIPVLTILDACVRLLPGVLDNPETLGEESFGAGEYADLLEYPQYTRPPEWRGVKVPEVLLSGNHAEIAKWRLAEAKRLTAERRPDLVAKKKAKTQ